MNVASSGCNAKSSGACIDCYSKPSEHLFPVKALLFESTVVGQSVQLNPDNFKHADYQREENVEETTHGFC